MNRHRRLILFCFTLLIGSSHLLHSTSHPEDTTAIQIGSFAASLDLTTSSLRHGSSSLDANGGCQVIYNVVVFQTSTGRIDYMINLPSAEVTGTGIEVDYLTTPEIVERMARFALGEGIRLDYSSCSTVPNEQQDTSRVYANTCVDRQGSGTTTQFSACGVAYSYRAYRYSCQMSSEPQISLVSNPSSSCAGQYGTCESTCSPNESNEISSVDIPDASDNSWSQEARSISTSAKIAAETTLPSKNRLGPQTRRSTLAENLPR